MFYLNAKAARVLTRRLSQPIRLLSIWLLLSFCTAAQSIAATPTDQLTLASAVQRSLAKDPALQAFKFRALGLQGQAETANLRPGYELTAELENFLGSDEFSGVDGSELTLSLSSVFEGANKRGARIALVNGTHAQLDAQRKIQVLALQGEVTRRYIEVLSAQQRLLLVERSAALAKDAYLAIKRRSAAGATPEAEVKRAQASSAQANMLVTLEQQQLDYFKTALAVLWGESEPEFSSVEGDLFEFGETLDFQTLYARLERNPSVLMFATETSLKEAELRLVESERNADIRWTAGLRRFQFSDDAALVAGITVPLWAAKKFAGQTTSAAAARDEIPLQKAVALRDLHTRLHRVFSHREQAILKTRVLQNEVIPLLEEALKETKSAYDQGRYPYLEWVAARQELLKAQRTLIDAATDVLHDSAKIKQLTAEPFAGVLQ